MAVSLTGMCGQNFAATHSGNLWGLSSNTITDVRFQTTLNERTFEKLVSQKQISSMHVNLDESLRTCRTSESSRIVASHCGLRTLHFSSLLCLFGIELFTVVLWQLDLVGRYQHVVTDGTPSFVMVDVFVVLIGIFEGLGVFSNC